MGALALREYDISTERWSLALWQCWRCSAARGIGMGVGQEGLCK